MTIEAAAKSDVLLPREQVIEEFGGPDANIPPSHLASFNIRLHYAKIREILGLGPDMSRKARDAIKKVDRATGYRRNKHKAPQIGIPANELVAADAGYILEALDTFLAARRDNNFAKRLADKILEAEATITCRKSR